MSGADDRPFGAHFVDASQQELPEPLACLICPNRTSRIGRDRCPVAGDLFGWQRSENFVGDKGPAKDEPHDYTPATPHLNEWGLTGNWTVGRENADLNDKDGSIYCRFHARDLHLVVSPGADGKPVRFQVTIDGKPPGAAMASTRVPTAMAT